MAKSQRKLNFALVFGAIFFSGTNWAQSNCLFKNPLCFYNSDVLSYIQVLHKHQDYKSIAPFFYGPYPAALGHAKFVERLANCDFGFEMKRVGIKETSKTSWSITYQRTIIGTSENFKVDCALINDTCRVFLDEAAWKRIFQPKSIGK